MMKGVLTMRGGRSSAGQGNGDGGASRTRLLDLLRLYFGYSSFRGQQVEVIEAVLSGKDCFCLMPTGGGKSMCYEIPALAKAGIVLVVSPLIALMENQVSGLKARKVAAEFLCSTQTAKVKNEIYEELDSGQPSLRLLYVTPELVATSGFISKLQKLYKRDLLSLIAIDEAHCISFWGHDFRPSFRKLSALRTHFPGVPMLALTATASKKVQDDVIKSLCLEHPRIFISSFNRPNIFYEVRYKDLLRNPYEDLRKLLEATPGECCIVYCHSRATCDEIGTRLSQAGISSRVYHAGLGDKKRSQALEDWASGKVPVVVATVAFGMGIDRKDVRIVCHFNVPKSLEGFYQESGRAGRDGMPSRSILYYGMEDSQLMRFLATKADPARKHQDREAVRKTIEKNIESFLKMVEYCEEARCRRQTVLAHFGEHVSTDVCAKTCDVCKSRSNVLGKLEDLGLLSSERREARSFSFIISSSAEKGGDDSSSLWDNGETESEDEISNSDEEEDESEVIARAVVNKGFHSVFSQAGRKVDARAKAVASRGFHTPLSQVDRKVDALVRAEEAFNAEHRPQKGGGSDSKKVIPRTFRDAALKRLQGAVMQSKQRLNISSVGADNASVILENECFQNFGKAGKCFYNSKLANTVRWLSTCSASDLESRVASSTSTSLKPSLHSIDVSLSGCQSPDKSTSGCGNASFTDSGIANNVEVAAKLPLKEVVVKEESKSLPPIPTFSDYRRGQAPLKYPLTRGPMAPFKKPRLVKDLL